MSGAADRGRSRRPLKMYLVASDYKIEDHLEGAIWLPRGSLCQEQESRREEQAWVKVLDSGSLVKIDRSVLTEVPIKVSGLLEPVTDTETRLQMFSRLQWLQRLAALPLGSELRVQIGSSGQRREGVLRYRGPLTRASTAVFFGVQLKGLAAKQGNSNGSHKGHHFFHCPEGTGLFLTANQLSPPSSQGKGSVGHSAVLPRATDLAPPSTAPLSQDSPKSSWDSDVIGARPCPMSPSRRAIVAPLTRVPSEPRTHQPPPLISSPRPSHNPPPPLANRPQASLCTAVTDQSRPSPLEKLEVGCMVEVNDPPLYGVIRWIGNVSGIPETVAGLELDQELTAATDGSYLSQRHFRCPANKGLFVKLRNCRRDSRFPSPEMLVNQVERCNSIAFAEWGSERVEEDTPPLYGKGACELYSGWKKGIQGHLNSCYLDASLFSLFSCSSSVDWVFLWPPGHKDGPRCRHAQDLLRCEIVNPLRRYGYVCASKTMALRRLLEAQSSDAGFTNQEKDPEEFLNKLFQLLRVEPLLRIRSVSPQPQECHVYQLFPPPKAYQAAPLPHSPTISPHLRVSSVQTLLEASFLHEGLKFSEAPSCLPLLMPRFGKEYKMFDAILPSLVIDITDLLDDSKALRNEECSICQSMAEWECTQCYEDCDITPGHLKQYCHTCNTQVHSHRKRLSHSPVKVGVPEGPWAKPLHAIRQRLSLFAVTCIQTSHYVSFVRYGPLPTDWLLFDSMADREGGENGFNVPQVRACPEVSRYLGLSEEELGKLDPTSLGGPARRLLCDSYMCLYHCPQLSLYK